MAQVIGFCYHMRDLDWVTCFQLWLLALWAFGEWASQWENSLLLFPSRLSSFPLLLLFWSSSPPSAIFIQKNIEASCLSQILFSFCPSEVNCWLVMVVTSLFFFIVASLRIRFYLFLNFMYVGLHVCFFINHSCVFPLSLCCHPQCFYIIVVFYLLFCNAFYFVEAVSPTTLP